MRRILPLIALVIAVGSLFAAGAWAHSQQQPVSSVGKLAAQRAADPFVVPAIVPQRDAGQHGFVYDYRTAASIGAEIDAKAAGHRAPAGHTTAGTSITISATILPSVNVTLSASGGIDKLTTNTESRDLRDVVIVVPHALDATTWAKLRSALQQSHAGIGTVYAA